MSLKCTCGREFFFPPDIPRMKVACICGESVVVGERLPRWVLLIGKFRRPSDVGPGDTFHRIAQKTGAERLAKIAKNLGIPCNCAERRAIWNETYPYDP